MRVLFVLCCLSMTACGVYATSAELKEAENLCGKNDGVKSIFVKQIEANIIYCNDGAIFYGKK